jgi:two-component system cell cycle sensor histidine kinase/response regulator CckA
MIGWIRLILGPPVFERDPEKTRTSAVVHTIALALATSQLIALFVPVYGGSVSRRHLLSGTAVVISIVGLLLTRRGQIRAASLIIVVGVWLLLTAGAATAGGLHGPAFSAYVVPVMCAGLLLGFRAAIWTTGASASAGLVMLWAETQGYLPVSSGTFTPLGLFITQITLLVLVVVLLHLSTRSIRESLERARLELAERKRAEEALRRGEAAILATEERFSKAFNASPTPMSIAKDGRFLEVNESLLRISGYTRAEIIGHNGIELGLFEDPADAGRMAESIADHGALREQEMNLRMKSGEIRTHLISADSIELGGEPCVLLVGIDISERKQAEEALKQSEAKFREFFWDSLTGDYISTPRGKLIACNPAFARMFGFGSVEEALDCDTRSLYPDPKYREDLLARLKEHGRLERLETEFRRRDGTPLYVVQNSVGVFDDLGELMEVKGYMFDITERRRLEEQFLQSQKLEAIGRLAGGVAHDFNNLLTVILSYSDLLLMPANHQPDSVQKYAERIKTASEHAASLTQQLLAFGRQQVLDVREVDVNSVVTATLQILNRLIGEDIELHTILMPGLIKARADAGQLQQVVMNLFVNARDAMPNGGKLTIETASVYLDEHWASQFVDAVPGPYVMLSVSDTGMGIDETTRAHIFEPFFTTKERGKGTGLGLATVHGIVKQSGGQISLYTEPGHGTTFKIYLPHADCPETTSAPSLGQHSSRTGSETILLVEDEPEVRRIARNILEANGYIVLEADGERAIQKSNDFPGIIHLLLTDVIMPKINGRELADRLGRERPEMRVLYMSGYTDRVIMDRGILPPGVALLGKPFTLTGLVDKVRQVLDSP